MSFPFGVKGAKSYTREPMVGYSGPGPGPETQAQILEGEASLQKEAGEAEIKGDLLRPSAPAALLWDPSDKE